MRRSGVWVLASLVVLTACTSHHRAVAIPAPSSPVALSSPVTPGLPRPAGVSPSAAPSTAAAVRPRPSPPRRPAPAATYVAVPAAHYVGRVQLRHGPSVPVVSVGTQGVLVPGGTVFRISGWGGGGLAVCSLSATDATGRWFAYTDAHLVLRVVDTRTGGVWALGKGCAPVWGAGGLAYMSTDDVNPPDGNPRSRIVVRATPLAAATVWAAGPVRPLVWAGHRLLFGTAGVRTKRRTWSSPPGPAVRVRFRWVPGRQWRCGSPSRSARTDRVCWSRRTSPARPAPTCTSGNWSHRHLQPAPTQHHRPDRPRRGAQRGVGRTGHRRIEPDHRRCRQPAEPGPGAVDRER